MKILAKKIPLFLSILPLLTSCYCFNEVIGNSSVRDLTVAKRIDLCNTSIDGKVFSITPYYGFPSTDKIQFSNEYSTLKHSSISSTGLIGIRGDYWVAPGKFFPFKILGIGIDYSYNSSNISLSNEGLYIDYFKTRKSNRIMGSANLMTFVQSKWIGYATVQLGVNLQKTIHSSFDYYDLQKSQLFDYRLGYGLQYYPNIPVGFSVEVGYGSGAFIKTGVTFWLF